LRLDLNDEGLGAMKQPSLLDLLAQMGWTPTPVGVWFE
jgi:hypothetical protein